MNQNTQPEAGGCVFVYGGVVNSVGRNCHCYNCKACQSMIMLVCSVCQSHCLHRRRQESSCFLRRNEDQHHSELPAGGRPTADSKKLATCPWRSWRRWGFCGLFSRCVFSASDRVRVPPALGRSWWSRCKGLGSRHCWWGGWRWRPSWRWCLKETRSEVALRYDANIHKVKLILLTHQVSPLPIARGF